MNQANLAPKAYLQLDQLLMEAIVNVFVVHAKILLQCRALVAQLTDFSLQSCTLQWITGALKLSIHLLARSAKIVAGYTRPIGHGMQLHQSALDGGPSRGSLLPWPGCLGGGVGT